MEDFQFLVKPLAIANRQQPHLQIVGAEKQVSARSAGAGGREVCKAKVLTLKKPQVGMISVEGFMTIDSNKVSLLGFCCLAQCFLGSIS